MSRPAVSEYLRRAVVAELSWPLSAEVDEEALKRLLFPSSSAMPASAREVPDWDIGALQSDLDEWLHYYNNERTHQGKMYCGRTPMETLTDGKQIWQEKFIH